MVDFVNMNCRAGMIELDFLTVVFFPSFLLASGHRARQLPVASAVRAHRVGSGAERRGDQDRRGRQTTRAATRTAGATVSGDFFVLVRLN